MSGGVLDGAALDLALHGEITTPKRYLERFGYAPPPPEDGIAEVPPIEAEVNHGRWIWRCPCTAERRQALPAGGGVVFVDDPIGWCPVCQNDACGGVWRTIRLPAERVAIERLLGSRPDPETRNWWAGETLVELAAEQVAAESAAGPFACPEERRMPPFACPEERRMPQGKQGKQGKLADDREGTR